MTDLQEWMNIYDKYRVDYNIIHEEDKYYLETISNPVCSIAFDRNKKFIDHGIWRNYDL